MGKVLVALGLGGMIAGFNLSGNLLGFYRRCDMTCMNLMYEFDQLAGFVGM